MGDEKDQSDLMPSWNILPDEGQSERRTNFLNSGAEPDIRTDDGRRRFGGTVPFHDGPYANRHTIMGTSEQVLKDIVVKTANMTGTGV